MPRLCLVLAALAAAVAPLPALALSKAAEYLIAQEVGLACGGGPGSYLPGSVVEQDLTGDGRPDLVIGHEGIACQDGPTGRSAECGMRLCTIRVWVRRGTLLELAVDDLQGAALSVGSGPMPAIGWETNEGVPVSIRWDGTGFR